MYLTILCGMWSCTKDNGNEVQMGEKVKVRLMYTLDTSNGGEMSRASTSNGEVFNEFFEKIKSGDLLASTYNITFTNVENGTIYSFSGSWEDNTFITIRTGKYNVTGYSTAEGTSIQDRCSIIFDEPIDITISSNTISLNGIYDCALIIFNDSKIESLQNFDGENNSSFFSFNNYKYAFVKDYLYLPAHKDKAYIFGAYTNGAEFQISTGNLKFTKGKYYVYNSVDNDFNLPPMEDGSVCENAILFADVNFKNALVSSYDTNYDGEICPSEAYAVTSINVAGKHISSLEGIEHFINIEELDGSNNNITSLDISNNNKLTKVILSNNPSLKKIIIWDECTKRNDYIQFDMGSVEVYDNAGNSYGYPYKVGQYIPWFNGGVVYEVSNNGANGKLISVVKAATKLAWSTENINTNAQNADDGMANMKTIKAINPDLSKYPAFKWCADYGLGWYLPSYTELQEIYNKRHIINEVLSAYGYTTIVTSGNETEHWSSYELSSSSARTIYLDAGHYWGNPNKYSIYKVRAVLAF